MYVCVCVCMYVCMYVCIPVLVRCGKAKLNRDIFGRNNRVHG